MYLASQKELNSQKTNRRKEWLTSEKELREAIPAAAQRAGEAFTGLNAKYLSNLIAPPSAMDTATRELTLERLSLGNIFTPQHELMLNKIKGEAALAEMMSADPILKAYPAPELVNTFNEVIRLMPEVLESPPVLTSVMRQLMERQYALEPTPLMGLVEKTREQFARPGTKSKKD